MSTSTRSTDVSASLIAEINRAHAETIAAGEAFIQSAIRCGQLLLEAKALIPHGKWGSWLMDNFDASERTAQKYMRVAAKWEGDRKDEHVALEDALDSIAQHGLGQNRRPPAVLPSPGNSGIEEAMLLLADQIHAAGEEAERIRPTNTITIPYPEHLHERLVELGKVQADLLRLHESVMQGIRGWAALARLLPAPPVELIEVEEFLREAA